MSRRLAAFAPFRSFIIALLGVATPAAALQYNIDLEHGEPSPDNFGNPSSSYAAAAPAGGEWNSVSLKLGDPQAVVNDSGSDTGVTLLLEATNGGTRWDNGSTTGDDGALLDDGYDVPEGLDTERVLTISGLLPGLWDVYTYAWRPLATDQSSTWVDVNGTGSLLVEPTSNVFAGFSVGETHVVHSVMIGAGEDLVITATNNDDVSDRSTLNGVQIVAVDVSPVEPKSWGTLKSSFGD